MFNKQATSDTQHNKFNANHRCGPFGQFGRMFGNNFEGKNHWREVSNRGFGNRKAANIEETDTAFIISLYAAGLQKNNFTVSVTADVLTIRYNAPATAENN